MIERNYTTEIDELAQKLYNIINNGDESTLLLNLAYLCGVAIGTMHSMDKDILAHRIRLADKEETLTQDHISA
jgi:hypothetical protein